MNMIGNAYSFLNQNDFSGQVMDTKFPYLPAVNVDNTGLGVSLATVGGGFGVCTPSF